MRHPAVRLQQRRPLLALHPGPAAGVEHNRYCLSVSLALVTGTSSGFGLATAERLTNLGWSVVGAMRDPSRAGTVPWEPVPLDLRDPASIIAVAARFGTLDALVSNAGFGLLGAWEELTSEELRDQLEVNLVGTMALCRACLPALREAGGVIVQVSSVSGQWGDPLFGAYNASKFGLEGASEALAEELKDQGVRVVVVEPGPFRTPIATKGPHAAGKDPTGRYREQWRETDEFLTFIQNQAEDAEIAVDAIVAAVTVPGAPFRIPVGKDAGTWVREHAEGVIADVERAEVFLEANRGLGLR
jgi:NAD(P)-dependent dehydrogenase (short-subunit alcohol dehydrogenase family)